jgi:hypothetical protein
VRVEFHPDASVEFRSAALWYDEQRAGLGGEFVAAVNDLLQRIVSTPESFPHWPGSTRLDGTIRKATVMRFPYLIAFEQHRHDIVVLAVAHQKRRPLYWLRRASRGTE